MSMSPQTDRQAVAPCAQLLDAHRLSNGWADAADQELTSLTLFQYPAMMPAGLPRDVTAALLQLSGTSRAGPVFDPFVGSGTTITAAMRLGLDAVGWDVNPLAILICRVKSGPLYLSAFDEATKRVLAGGETGPIDERFPNWRHWFTDDVAQGLTNLRTRIVRERSSVTRRFLWLCLAETVRLTSNSRTSSVKLHKRDATQVARRPAPPTVFARVAAQNLERLAAFRTTLEATGFSRRGHYSGTVNLRLGDSRSLRWSGASSKLLLTSPPYGDNRSTIAYGQHAYLPLQWLDLADVDPAAGPGHLTSTYEIDRRSLGGHRRLDDVDASRLHRSSPTLDRLVRELETEPRDRRTRVTSFMRDLDVALRRVPVTVAAGNAAVFIVGSRQVGGKSVQLGQILIELAAHHGLEHLTTLERDIPLHRKRMARRNSVAHTIRREHVVVFRVDPVINRRSILGECGIPGTRLAAPTNASGTIDPHTGDSADGIQLGGA